MFTRLFFGILTMVVGMMAIAAFLISHQAEAALNEKTSQQLRDASAATMQEVDSRVQSIVTALQSFASTYKNSKVSNSQAFGIFSDIVTNNASISELQLATTDGRYLTFPGSPLDAGYDPRKTDWFSGALNQNSAYITDVFQFSQTEFPKIAVSLALRNDKEEPVGVVVAFVSVPKLSEFIGQIKLGQTGYAMIVDQYGKLVAHPDKPYALKRPSLDKLPVVRDVITGKAGIELVSMNGRDTFAAYQFDNWLKWGILVMQEASEVQHEVRRLQLTIAAIALIGLAAVGVLLFLFVRTIIRPITEVQQKMQAFSEGDLFQTMQAQSNDEIRQLADSFNRMSGQIRTIIGKIQNAIFAVNEVAHHVGKGSRHSHAMQSEVVTVTERLAHEMDKQQTQTEEIRSFMENITQEMEHIASSMQTAIAQNRDSREQTAVAASSIELLKGNMEKITQDMKASLQAMSSMKASMEDVRGILELITDISKRTKLLSFNARIEASRAGQAGMGFGVVADEIRLLSEQTEEATARIRQVLTSGEQRMEHVAACMQTTDHATVDGIDTLHKATDIFLHTVQISDELTSQFETIGQLAQQIQQQSQFIQSRVDRLASSAREVVSGTQQAVAANQESLSLSEQFLHDSERLARIAADLEQDIRFFRTGERPSA